MSIAIERCKSYARPFKGPSNIRNTLDHLIKSNTTVVQFLIKMHELSKYGFDLKTGGSSKIPPLSQATATTNIKLMEWIIKDGGSDLLTLGDSMGRIPIFIAVHHKALESLKILIELGSPINITHTYIDLPRGATPLLMAVRLKDTEMTKLVRKHGGQCAMPMEESDVNFLKGADAELSKEKAALNLEIDVATGKFFPVVLRDLITDYA